MASAPIDRGRRRFLTLTRRPPALRPPWTDPTDFEDRCLRCGACIAACPQSILIAGDGGFPEADLRRGECTFCAAACPEPLFDLGRRPPWRAVARIGDVCLARRGIVCQSCRDACAESAIGFEPVLRGALAALPGVEVHAAAPNGKLVITLETAGEAEIVARINAISRLDGVLSAALVYHQVEDLSEEAREP